MNSPTTYLPRVTPVEAIQFTGENFFSVYFFATGVDQRTEVVQLLTELACSVVLLLSLRPSLELIEGLEVAGEAFDVCPVLHVALPFR